MCEPDSVDLCDVPDNLWTLECGQNQSNTEVGYVIMVKTEKHSQHVRLTTS